MIDTVGADCPIITATSKEQACVCSSFVTLSGVAIGRVHKLDIVVGPTREHSEDVLLRAHKLKWQVLELLQRDRLALPARPGLDDHLRLGCPSLLAACNNAVRAQIEAKLDGSQPHVPGALAVTVNKMCSASPGPKRHLRRRAPLS